MERVVLSMLNNWPFFGNLVLHLPLVPTDEVRSVATDGDTMYFNPQWVETNTADDIVTAAARLVLSCGLKHHLRREDRDYGRWQEASKLVTLPFLRDAGLYRGPGGLNMTVEQAYETIPEQPPGDDGEGGGGGQGQGGGSGGGGNGPDLGEILDAPPQPQQGDGQGQGEGQGQGQSEGQGQGSGSGSGNSQSGQDQGQGNPSGGQQPQPPQSQQTSRREQEQKWEERMQQALQMAKNAGLLPGMINEAIQASHNRKIDWRTELRRFMTHAGKDDYTYMRPNRRFVHQGLYLPGLYSDGMGPVVMAVDTSGSMNEPALAAVWGELSAACKDVNPEQVIVIQCDAAVSAIDHYAMTDLPDTLEVYGRGGTRFSPVWEAVDQIGVKPAVLVYFTDLHCYDYGDMPDYPVIWAAVDQEYYPAPDPPFGEKIEIVV